MKEKIRAVVVDDSAFYRQAIVDILSQTAEIEVVRTARNGLDAIRAVSDSSPDVITLDLEMPEMDGFTFLRWLMNNRPTPVVIISSRSDAGIVFRALELGAVDFFEKPAKGPLSGDVKVVYDLILKVKTAASIPKGKLLLHQDRSAAHYEKPITFYTEKRIVKIVAVGASTGGPSAIREIIRGLPRDLPAAIVISQHMPPVFTGYFAERLNRLGVLPVKEASNGERIEGGVVYISPGGMHFLLKRDEKEKKAVTASLLSVRAEDKYSPSVDILMSSAAEVSGPGTIGVLLTGMGNDGKKGIRKIKESGGRTIAESESTAIVFGMPKEAILDGSIDKILPISEIAGEIVERCRIP
ncbi:MAG: chemotaxis response regulator protein-glutamate methylesterase [Nitrospirae bacterium]|nr:chemotaxis response regulator protein-glutamate methylesterase [Nitrospirota bacterium]